MESSAIGEKLNKRIWNKTPINTNVLSYSEIQLGPVLKLS